MKVSVVITTYNRCEYVIEALRSVLTQTRPVHQAIVVCDGSTDGTALKLRENFPEVLVIEQPNLGRSIARNTGVAHATGDWVGFLDDDDLWHQDKLKKSHEYAQKNKECGAINNHLWFFADSETGPFSGFGLRRDFVANDLEACHQRAEEIKVSSNKFDYLDICGNSYKLLLERNRGTLSGTLVRKDLFIRSGGFAAGEAYAEDWHFFLNISRLTEWHTIREPLGFQRLHSLQSTNNTEIAVNILAAKVSAWYCGRAFPEKKNLAQTIAALRNYGREYRTEIQAFMWSSLLSGNFRIASILYSTGKLLLPSVRDRIYILIPPQITWRFERYILGMHQ